MPFRLLRDGEQAEQTLLLPFRYALETGQTEGAIGDAPGKRPVVYFLHEAGHTVIVVNSSEERSRIPVDELRDMAHSRTAQRRKEGKDQERADWEQTMRQWYLDWWNWIWDRRHGRVSFGPGTFEGNRRR